MGIAHFTSRGTAALGAVALAVLPGQVGGWQLADPPRAPELAAQPVDLVTTDDETRPGYLDSDRMSVQVAGRNTAQALIRTAQSQVNIGRESAGNCNPYGPCAEWCHYFASWVGRTSGNGAITPQTGYTPTGVSYFRARGAYHSTPRPGDYVYYYRESKGRVGHVGIVEWVNGGTMGTIEGNTGGSGSTVTRRAKPWGPGTDVDGFGRPNYVPAPTPPPPPPAEPPTVTPAPGNAFPLLPGRGFGVDPGDKVLNIIGGYEGARYRTYVAKIQKRLGHPQTGYYMPGLRASVLVVERQLKAAGHPVTVDGVVGSETWRLLFP